MPANIQELQQAFSLTAQTAIDVASTDLMRIKTTSSDLADLEPVVEDDAAEIGKGHEFAEESFLTHWKVAKKVQCYNSAELLSLCAAYGLGSGNAGTYTPIDPLTNTNEIELPYMTLLESIRKGGTSEVLNRAMLGMIVDKFKITLSSGPGRANSKIEMDLVGTGRFDAASAIAMPDLTPVHLLNASSLSLVINGVDYVTAKSFETLEWDWDNKVREGYYPGSGFQTPGDPTSGQVQGRMEYGVRSLNFFFMARFQHGSTELTTLNAQTAGTAVIGLSGATGYNATITQPQNRFKTSKIENQNGIVTVRVDVSVQKATGLDLVTMVVNNTLGNVGRA